MCRFCIYFVFIFSLTISSLFGNERIAATSKELAYIVSDTNIPFWEIMSRGIETKAKELGYKIKIYSADNSTKQELANLSEALKNNVTGLIISPTNSSSCVTMLRLAKRANLPVVISDIGTDEGDYVAYIASDNKSGAYAIGKILTSKLHKLGWQDGRVGIIAIPQKRANGQARTAGFMRALEEAGIKSAAIKQQVTFSYEETHAYTLALVHEYPNIRALWLQGSNQYKAALQALEELGKNKDVLLLTFDAEPEFLELIPNQTIAVSAMQQPFLMGEKAVEAMHKHLQGEEIEKNIQLPVLAVSSDNIDVKLSAIKRNVLGVK